MRVGRLCVVSRHGHRDRTLARMGVNRRRHGTIRYRRGDTIRAEMTGCWRNNLGWVSRMHNRWSWGRRHRCHRMSTRGLLKRRW